VNEEMTVFPVDKNLGAATTTKKKNKNNLYDTD